MVGTPLLAPMTSLLHEPDPARPVVLLVPKPQTLQDVVELGQVFVHMSVIPLYPATGHNAVVESPQSVRHKRGPPAEGSVKDHRTGNNQPLVQLGSDGCPDMTILLSQSHWPAPLGRRHPLFPEQALGPVKVVWVNRGQIFHSPQTITLTMVSRRLPSWSRTVIRPELPV